MDQGAIDRAVAEHRRASRPKRPSPPFGAVAIGVLQFVKAGVLLVTAALLYVRPGLLSTPDSPLGSLLYVALRGGFDALSAALQGSNALAGLLLGLGFYLALIGFGLFRLSPWARRSVMLNALVTLALFARSTFQTTPTAMPAADMIKLSALLGLDFVTLFLLFMPGTRAVFASRR